MATTDHQTNLPSGEAVLVADNLGDVTSGLVLQGAFEMSVDANIDITNVAGQRDVISSMKEMILSSRHLTTKLLSELRLILTLS